MENENERDDEKFNERFETIEQALKYIADSQAGSEWLRKKSDVERRQLESERRQFETERRQFEKESKQRWRQIEKHLAHITKLTGIAFEELTFNDEKLEEAGKTLSRKRR